jgi:hypothetical protein
MKATDIIKEILTRNADIIARYGARVFANTAPEKAQMPLLVYSYKIQPQSTKDGVYAYKILGEVMSLKRNKKDLEVVEEELIDALQNQIVVGENMSAITITEAYSNIDTNFNDYSTRVPFEFELFK